MEARRSRFGGAMPGSMNGDGGKANGVGDANASASETDAQLVLRARAGDEQAFETLVRRHLRSAFAAALPLVSNEADAEDVCQDAFIRALERLDDCRDPARFRAWFLTIVRNRAHNVRKYLRRREAEPIDNVAAVGSRNPMRDMELSELSYRLRAALDQLTERQRQVVLLHDYEGWQHAEIGKRLGMTAGASRFSLHAARKKLRSLLAKDASERASP